jgi:hypothetical protein
MNWDELALNPQWSRRRPSLLRSFSTAFLSECEKRGIN